MGERAEQAAARIMKERAYTIRISLNIGEKDWYLVTSDLSLDYVKINADYRS